MAVLKKSKLGTDPKGSDPYDSPLDISKLIEGVESKPIIPAVEKPIMAIKLEEDVSDKIKGNFSREESSFNQT